MAQPCPQPHHMAHKHTTTDPTTNPRRSATATHNKNTAAELVEGRNSTTQQHINTLSRSVETSEHSHVHACMHACRPAGNEAGQYCTVRKVEFVNTTRNAGHQWLEDSYCWASADGLLLLLLLPLLTPAGTAAVSVVLLASSSSISTVWLARDGGMGLRVRVAARMPGGSPMPDKSLAAELGCEGSPSWFQ